MVDQAQIDQPLGEGETAPAAVARSSGEFVQDLLALSELQLKLLVADWQQGLRRLLLPAGLFVGGLALAGACLPIALIAVALALVETTTLTYARAFAVSLLAGTGLAVVVFTSGWLWLRQWHKMFDRSLAEWRQNVQWVKESQRRQKSRRMP